MFLFIRNLHEDSFEIFFTFYILFKTEQRFLYSLIFDSLNAYLFLSGMMALKRTLRSSVVYIYFSVSYRDEEDELLQLAIQQSLAESSQQSPSDHDLTSPWSNTRTQEEDDVQR